MSCPAGNLNQTDNFHSDHEGHEGKENQQIFVFLRELRGEKNVLKGKASAIRD